jgi:hypothetical protein
MIAPVAKVAFNIVKKGISFFSHFRQKRTLKASAKLLHLIPENTQQIARLNASLSAIAKLYDEEFEVLQNSSTFITRYMKRLSKKFDALSLHDQHAIKLMVINDDLTLLVNKIEKFLRGMQQLATGQLDRDLVSSSQLRSMLNYIQYDLKDHYPDYEITFPSLSHIYNAPIEIVYRYDDMVLIQIPIYIQHYQTEQMDLFELNVVEVPVHSDLTYPLENERNPYTKVKLNHDLIGMTKNAYMPYDSKNLEDCRKIGGIYYCEAQHLVQIATEHICASAIYYDVDPKIIQDKCEFDYIHEHIPEPQYLDAGNEVLLVGMPEPWELICNKNRDIPMPLNAGPYVVVRRRELCQCSLRAALFYLHETISSCDTEHIYTKDRSIKYYFTINTAVATRLESIIPQITDDPEGILQYTGSKYIPTQYLSGSMLSDRPYDINVQNAKVLDYDEQNEELTALDDHAAQKVIGWNDTAQAILKNAPLFMDQNDIVMGDRNPNLWFEEGGNPWMGVLLILSLVGALSAILYVCLIQQWGKVKARMGGVSTRLAEQGLVLGTIKGVSAAPAVGPTVVFKFNLSTVVTFILAEIIVSVVLYILYKVIRRLVVYLTSDYLDTPGNFMLRNFVAKCMTNQNVDIILQIYSTKLNKTQQIYVTTRKGHPALFRQEGRIRKRHITLQRQYWNDSMVVQWEKAQLFYENRHVLLPAHLPISILGKRSVRQIMESSDVQTQILILKTREYMALNPPYVSLGRLNSDTNVSDDDLTEISRHTLTDFRTPVSLKKTRIPNTRADNAWPGSLAKERTSLRPEPMTSSFAYPSSLSLLRSLSPPKITTTQF